MAPAAPRVKGQDERKTALDARRTRCVWLTITNAGVPALVPLAMATSHRRRETGVKPIKAIGVVSALMGPSCHTSRRKSADRPR